MVPSRSRHRLDAVEVTAVGRVGEAPAATVPLDVLLTLAQTVRDRATLRFDYLPRGEDSPQPRRVEPHDLATSHGRWYLLARDLEREDWRLFSADRVRPRVPSDAPFLPRVVPGGDVEAFVSARFKGSGTNEWPCRGTVLLHAPARDVLPFAGDGVVGAVDEERCTLIGGSRSWGCARRIVRTVPGRDGGARAAGTGRAFAAQAERFAAAGEGSSADPRSGRS